MIDTWVSMSLIAEQVPNEKKTVKYSDPDEQFTLPHELKLLSQDFSGDHPYRRRRL
jgi:hypothetical protein